MSATDQDLSFIGFGEAAQAFTNGMRGENPALAVLAYDIKTDGADADLQWATYEDCGVSGAISAQEAVANAPVIFSLVTAEQAEDAARAVAGDDLGGALYLDCNSCAPETKRRASAAIDASGGRYVDVAVMTPVHPKLHKAPCLIAGPHCDAALDAMRALGMSVTSAGPAIGDASSRKMIRSVMVKGLEALTLECFLAARKAGIDKEILASLDQSYPGFNWPERAPYMIERAMTHGTRRAAEMREVAKTLQDLGIAPDVTNGTVARQSQAGAMGLNAQEIGADNLSALIDAILNEMNAE